jgi:hypothetical protein
LSEALVDLNRKTLSRQPIFHLVSGDALELWMLKVACGLYFSVGSKDRMKIATKHSIDLERVQRAFFEDRWDRWAGLYVRAASGDLIKAAHGVGIAPLTMDQNLCFSGAIVSLHGFRLELVFDTTGTNPGPWGGLVRQPSELVWSKKQREHHIILTWPPGTPEASIQMKETTRRPTALR